MGSEHRLQVTHYYVLERSGNNVIFAIREIGNFSFWIFVANDIKKLELVARKVAIVLGIERHSHTGRNVNRTQKKLSIIITATKRLNKFVLSRNQ